MISSALSNKPFKTPRRRALEELALRKARHSLTAFKRLMWKRYQHAPHLEALDRALEQCVRCYETHGREGYSHLIIQLPPRHGKTLTVSRFLPAWFLGNHPDARVIMASYGATLAEKNSRYARKVVQTKRYQSTFPGVTLDPVSHAADAWDILDREGGVDALGVGGGVTGKGGDLIVCDDVIKSRAEAESEIYRQKTWDWFTDDLYTRRNDEYAPIVVCMTRWQTDDLAGRLLREQPGKWHILNLPALAEENDVLGRQPGDPLWPERFSLTMLQDIQDTLGEYSWNALYQQRPIAAEGGIFKRANFGIIQSVPECSVIVRYWDLAMSEKTSADYSVGVKMGMGLDGRTKILDVARRRVEWDQLAAFMADVALQDGPECQIGFERQGYMTRAGQALAQDSRLHHYAIWGYTKDKDKLTNALPFAARVGLQMVDVVEAQWTRDFLDELCSFPRGAHDDQVDAGAGAYEMLGGDVMVGALNYADESGIA
jgi:predicted phage terminase large subunit-like protein